MKFLLLLLLFSIFFFDNLSAENLNTLLHQYAANSDLSKITKKESAGFLEVYTRRDLERMQVQTLQDILKIIPGFTLNRTSNNLIGLSRPTTPNIDSTAVRLYINDHDMSSSAFGSASLIWGELPLEYIDHIEVYKGTSSIEFGNECATFTIKLYTKTAQREVGKKLRLSADSKQSANLDGYIASTLDDFSYFAYVNLHNINRTRYTNYYNGNTYDFKSDHEGTNFYVNLNYKNTTIELGSYTKRADSFLGIGTHRTPTGGELDAYQHYIHLTHKFESGVKLQLSYDMLSYKRTYQDPNDINVANLPALNYYLIKFDDTIAAVMAEQRFSFAKHSLLLGAFIKQKRFQEYGEFIGTSVNHPNSFNNTLLLSSAYVEYTYDYDENTRFIASLKDDYFRYDKNIDTNNELIIRCGMIKNIDKLQLKTFFTKSYIPTPFYKLYNPENIPYKANPHLKNTNSSILSATLRYKTQKQTFEFLIAAHKMDNYILYNRTTSYGYFNSNKILKYNYYEFNYSYFFDIDNKLLLTFYTGKNSKNGIFSPRYNSIVRLFNRYKKFDIYNEFIYKSAYDNANVTMDASLDFNTAVKYHTSQDLSWGLRAENILNDGDENAYRGYNTAIPVNDREIWLTMEYLF
jgi:iron complex outermembrane receptor protein